MGRYAKWTLQVIAMVLVTRPAFAQGPWITSDIAPSPSSGANGMSDIGQVVGSFYGPGGLQHAYSWTAAGGFIDRTLPGGTQSAAYAVNNIGQVVGYSFNAAGNSMRSSGRPQEGWSIPRRSWPRSVARGINDFGQVVGSSTTIGGTDHAFLWSGQTGMVDLGMLREGPSATPRR